MQGIVMYERIKDAVKQINNCTEQINNLVSALSSKSNDPILLSFVLSDANCAAAETKRLTESLSRALDHSEK